VTNSAARLKTTRSLILAAGALAVSGIALSATGSEDFGKWLTLLGVALLVVGLHRFGRSGPDEALELEPAPGRRKKRKKRDASEPPADAGDAPSSR
jgi:predicted cobalt transporter CbtA